MNGFFDYTVLGLVEGMTEFLPVSSSGHLILAHELLGVTANGLAVDAVLQLATALAIVVYFWKDLWRLVETFFGKLSGKQVESGEWNLIWALIVGTVPGVILGLFLEKDMETIFRSSHVVAYMLIVGSLIMLAAEYFHRATAGKSVSILNGFFIGLFQCLALVPGMSRSGMTIAGGLFLGFSREDAARFGFLLAVPIILGSGAKKLIDLVISGDVASLGAPLLWGSVVAFASGLAAIHALMLFVKKQPLYLFVAYRVLLAGAILVWL